MEDLEPGVQRGAPSFLEIGRTGRASIWLYILGIFSLGVCGNVLGVIAALFVLGAALATGIVAGIDPTTAQTGNNLVDFLVLGSTHETEKSTR